MEFGSGDYTYTYADGWLKTPPGWVWGWIPAVACDSRDRVFVYSRSQHPLAVFDRDGNFVETWGEGVLAPLNKVGFVPTVPEITYRRRDHECIIN